MKGGTLGARSRERLAQADLALFLIVSEAVRIMDLTVLESHRPKERQNALFRQGASKVQWPNSKHNTLPSKAVDIAPWPVDWNDRESFCLLAGVMFAVASRYGFKLRWGGDWNRDGRTADESFRDYGHFELLEDE
jgi:peptidoglycan L-alanyl-D-glutamate endopeptidase CwlK